MQYLIKWNEYFNSENTWKSAEHLKAAQQFDVYKAVNSVTKKVLKWQNFRKQIKRK